MYFERISQNKHEQKKIADIHAFLKENGLSLDEQIETFIVTYSEQGEILACGGIAGNIIKCVSISEYCRGEGIALQLITELIKLAYELNRTHLFIYTKPEYETLFNACGFYTISRGYPNIVLLENSATRLKKQCEKWNKAKVNGDKIAAIVMNANPFTLGHKYLIEQALSQTEHLHLFIVGGNNPLFSYEDRFLLVKQGISNLKNITLHQASDYIISRATFPNYFLKDKGITDDLYLEIDLKLFRQHIAPALGITHRFVGTEPICSVTAEYNHKMHYWLEKAELSAPKINIIELERQTIHDQPISASRVRLLLQEKKWDELKELLPETTFRFLQKNFFDDAHGIIKEQHKIT